MQRELSELLLESMRNDSVLRGSSKEYKAVQANLKESIKILATMEKPNKEQVDRLESSLDKLKNAASAYENHKKTHSSESQYEKNRKETMSKILQSAKGKHSGIENSKEKHFSRERDVSMREEKASVVREENKYQIKMFVSNLMKWNEQMPKENQERALASAILAGSMAEYAFKCFGVGKDDKVFKMSQNEFDQKITELVGNEKFQNYYKSLDKEQLAATFARQEPIESYLKDFRDAQAQENAAQEKTAQEKTAQEKTETTQKNTEDRIL